MNHAEQRWPSFLHLHCFSLTESWVDSVLLMLGFVQSESWGSYSSTEDRCVEVKIQEPPSCSDPQRDFLFLPSGTDNTQMLHGIYCINRRVVWSRLTDLQPRGRSRIHVTVTVFTNCFSSWKTGWYSNLSVAWFVLSASKSDVLCQSTVRKDLNTQLY